jgi:hypothetical protein
MQRSVSMRSPLISPSTLAASVQPGRACLLVILSPLKSSRCEESVCAGSVHGVELGNRELTGVIGS